MGVKWKEKTAQRRKKKVQGRAKEQMGSILSCPLLQSQLKYFSWYHLGWAPKTAFYSLLMSGKGLIVPGSSCGL
jgi:hypothetical protein